MKRTCAGKTGRKFRTTKKNRANGPIRKTEIKPNGSSDCCLKNEETSE